MTKHKCDKELVLQKIQSDLGYIKKAIVGNGEEGLIKSTKHNTEFRLQIKGFIAGITAFAAIIGAIVGWIIHKVIK